MPDVYVHTAKEASSGKLQLLVKRYRRSGAFEAAVCWPWIVLWLLPDLAVDLGGCLAATAAWVCGAAQQRASLARGTKLLTASPSMGWASEGLCALRASER